MLTHANLSSNALDFSRRTSNCCLPMSRCRSCRSRTSTSARSTTAISFVAFQSPTCEQMETVAQALLEVQPTMMAAVPRFYEKIYANIIEQGPSRNGIQAEDFRLGDRVAGEGGAVARVRQERSARRADCDGSSPTGSSIRRFARAWAAGFASFSSGGAPLAPELAEFFWSVGLPVYQGYGLTETSPVVTCEFAEGEQSRHRGPPIPNVEVRIADDGEILVKGPCVMQGYYHKPDADARGASRPTAGFATGDIGRLDEDGYLIITDRKKELLKTAAANLLRPAPIENLLKTSPLHLECDGGGRRAQIRVRADRAEFHGASRRRRARRGQRIRNARADGRRSLGSGPAVARKSSGSRHRSRSTKSRSASRCSSRISRYENGELTYTLKLKRRVIEERYQDVIARLYADVEEPRPQHLR